jgi:pSer/pThr/pTyr-binding forkhead associated (FHA) protein
VIEQNTARIEDLGSKNGTWLRGERITAPRTLENGDTIRIGSVTFTARSFSEGSTATEIEALPAAKTPLPEPRPRRGS